VTQFYFEKLEARADARARVGADTRARVSWEIEMKICTSGHLR